jgi:hypothetical protein
VQIIVDIYLGDDGRPTGTIRPLDGAIARPFSGNLQFLALVESLYRGQANTSGEGHTESEGNASSRI